MVVHSSSLEGQRTTGSFLNCQASCQLYIHQLSIFLDCGLTFEWLWCVCVTSHFHIFCMYAFLCRVLLAEVFYATVLAVFDCQVPSLLPYALSLQTYVNFVTKFYLAVVISNFTIHLFNGLINAHVQNRNLKWLKYLHAQCDSSSAPLVQVRPFWCSSCSQFNWQVVLASGSKKECTAWAVHPFIITEVFGHNIFK